MTVHQPEMRKRNGSTQYRTPKTFRDVYATVPQCSMTTTNTQAILPASKNNNRGAFRALSEPNDPTKEP